jgi:zinc protease
MEAAINSIINRKVCKGTQRLMHLFSGLTSSLRYFAFFVFLTVITLFSIGAQASPDIQHWETSNGARVYYVHAPELPMVDVRVIFDAGSARDSDTAGLASFTNGMLEEGAGNGGKALDADAIASRFDSVGASFSLDSMRDMAILDLRSLTDPKRLQPALETMALIINQPSFPDDALERVRKQILIGLRYDEQSPGTIASKAYYAALFGDHPYASPSSGTRESIAALQRSDLIAFYQRYYVGRNAVVAMVGDLDRSQTERVAEQLVGALPAGAAAPALPQVAPITDARLIHREHPSKQTHVLIGQPGSRRGDPDYFPLYIGNHILGGSGLVSRISDEVREKRGLAYSAYSYFSPMRLEGPFTMGLQTRNNEAEEAIAVLRQTLKRFVDEGPSTEELQAAKNNITGGFPLNIDSNKDIVGYIGMIGFYQLPLDYLERFNQRVEAVTLEQIKDAFRRRIHPDRLVTVTVGGKE